MNKIFNNPKINIYGSSAMINKYIYMKRITTDMTLYHIYKIDKVINEDTYNIIYESERSFVFKVPKDKNQCAYTYDDIKQIHINAYDELYELSKNEWLNTFRVFVENDGIKAKSLPDKIIQSEDE